MGVVGEGGFVLVSGFGSVGCFVFLLFLPAKFVDEIKERRGFKLKLLVETASRSRRTRIAVIRLRIGKVPLCFVSVWVENKS